MRMAAIALAFVVASNVPALAFTEADVERQSKFCENATRLPWGDVDQYLYDDCMTLQRQLRPPEQAAKTMGKTDPAWMRHLDGSAFLCRRGGLHTLGQNSAI
jgi:hypothetical protein